MKVSVKQIKIHKSVKPPPFSPTIKLLVVRYPRFSNFHLRLKLGVSTVSLYNIPAYHTIVDIIIIIIIITILLNIDNCNLVYVINVSNNIQIKTH